MEFPPRESTGRTNGCADGRIVPRDEGLRGQRPGSQTKHLVWHQELICPGEPCCGRVQTFPPGVLVDDGRRERRWCPVCGASVTVPAFYLGGSLRDARIDPVAVTERAGVAVPDPRYGDGDANRQHSPRIAAAPTMSVSHAVTGALVVTVVGTVGPDAAGRLRYEIVKFLRAGLYPVVLDLLQARGSERIIVAALRNLHASSSTKLPDRTWKRSTHGAENGAGQEDDGDEETNGVGLRLVLDPAAADTWALLDHTAIAVYLTLADALEP